MTDGRSLEELAAQMSPNFTDLPLKIPATSQTTRERTEHLWSKISAPAGVKDTLLRDHDLSAYSGNIENLIGTLSVPLGIAGPLRINGLCAKGDYIIPLATTEAALVASYHRGANLISEAGGCTAMLLQESLSRSPFFAFESLADAGRFLHWTLSRFEELQKVAASTTRFGQLVDIATTVEGNHVYLTLEFHTADASGQNMVTLATQAICDHIILHSPVPPVRSYVEANLSGDKKASARAFTSTRGKKVSAEVRIPSSLIEKRLHCTVSEVCQYWQSSAIGGVLSGTMGIQGHFANGLAALYLATGQDVACVAESAIGVTRFEQTFSGDLYAAVTLPGIMVGTVGGGTSLPTQNACLQLMGLAGAEQSRALAEVTASLLLAGELSIIGALAAGHFSRAHRKLARGNHRSE